MFRAILIESMPNTKKVFIRREVHEIVIVRRASRMLMFCPACGSHEDFLSLDEAAGVLQTGTREILRKIEANELHEGEAPNGQMLLCAKSLAGNADVPSVARQIKAK